MKELVITPPEGYEVDGEKSTFEKIVFKPIDSKPKSWEEFCVRHPVQRGEYGINTQLSNGIICYEYGRNRKRFVDRDILPSKEYAEAFLALMQLISLRQVWIGDWNPKANSSHWCMYYNIDTNNVEYGQLGISHALEFPTKEMLEEFFHCFRDLLEQAKSLL